jgi:hypothetical protein
MSSVLIARSASASVSGFISGDLAGGANRAGVFFVVGTVAVAVLEIDAEVLDRLLLELVGDFQVDAFSQLGLLVGDSDDLTKRFEIWRVSV